MRKRRGPGRDTAKERFWRELVNGFDPERGTVRQWCAEHGVSEPSFYGWRRALQHRDRERASRARPNQRVELIPVNILPSPVSAADGARTRLIVRLTGGVRLYVTVEQLPAVLDVLEARRC
jgi:transposase-like protein